MKRILSVFLALALLLGLLPAAALAEEAGAANVFILPSGLQAVEDEAFAGNTTLGTLIVPNTVTDIGSKAFGGCTGLSEVTIAGRDVTISDDAFENCSRDVVFYAHNGSTAMTWALAHGYVCQSLDDGSEYFDRFAELIAHSGFSTSMLMSGRFASKCLIVRTQDGRLPDISAYHPTDIFKSEDNLYYVQFAEEGITEACYEALYEAGCAVEPDMVGESDDVTAQGVTIAANWGTDDTMGFDTYAPFVAERSSGALTIAVIDSGLNSGNWAGTVSSQACSLVGGNVMSDSIRHGSKVASIISDCLGSNVNNVTLLPIKVVNTESMYRTSVVIEGLKRAIANGANIINLSLGWDHNNGTSPEIVRQIGIARSKGILVVAAAGNGAGEVMFPASCNGVIAVSALTYSNAEGYKVRSRTGSAIAYAAPGSFLKSTAYSHIDLAGDNMGTASTSFAAPQIAAALALIKLDSSKSGSAIDVLNSCSFAPEGLTASAVGRGMPDLKKLVVIPTTDITMANADGGAIPERLWLGDQTNEFTLTWDIQPTNSTEKVVSVTSSDASIVSVSQSGGTSARISAAGAGEATITVTCGSVTKQFDLVVERPVAQISIAGFTDDVMLVGQNVQLSAYVTPADATKETLI